MFVRIIVSKRLFYVKGWRAIGRSGIMFEPASGVCPVGANIGSERMGRSYVTYLAALMLFGTNGIVASMIDLPSYAIVFTRAILGTAFLALVFALGRKKPVIFRAGKQAAYVAVSGAAMGASWMLLYEAYQLIGVSVSTLLYYCGPVIVMVLAPVFFKERTTLAMGAGFLAVIVGMVCVNGIDPMTGDSAKGFLCGVLAAVAYAVMVIANKKATMITGVENSLWQLVFAGCTVGAFMLAARTGGFSIPLESSGPILLLGVVNTGFGCYLYFSSIKELSAQTISLLGYLEPLSALVLSAALLGEHLGAVQMVGAVLILGGAAFGELAGRRRRLEPAEEVASSG